MPEQISTADFVRETWGDINSPTTSSFVPKMGKCKTSVAAIEEVSRHDISHFIDCSSHSDLLNVEFYSNLML